MSNILNFNIVILKKYQISYNYILPMFWKLEVVEFIKECDENELESASR